MKKRSSNSGAVILRPSMIKWLAVLGMTGCWWVSSCRGAPEPELVSSLAELNQLVSMDDSRVVTLDIDGTVWWSGKTEGRVILKDDTAVVQLELDVPCQMPALDDRLALEGDCTAIKTRDVIKLSGVPVVDHDGLHPPEIKSGAIHLKAGRHPIRVGWFDRTDRCALEVGYEGPDLPRQTIPDEVLFHRQADSETGMTNFVNGLEY